LDFGGSCSRASVLRIRSGSIHLRAIHCSEISAKLLSLLLAFSHPLSVQLSHGFIVQRAGIIKAEVLSNKREIVSLSNDGQVELWDSTKASCVERFQNQSNLKPEEFFQLMIKVLLHLFTSERKVNTIIPMMRLGIGFEGVFAAVVFALLSNRDTANPPRLPYLF
jgi:hypothetical protein